jgi:phospholipase C
MTSASRRRFLRLASATVAGAALPPALRAAMSIPAARVHGTIMDVQHVVILMQENRSFDHYFGTLPGVRGFGDRFTIPLPGGRTVWEQMFRVNPDIPMDLPGPAQNPRPRAEPDHDRVVLPYHLDSRQGNAQRVTGTPHGWNDAQAAWDHGRLHEWPSYKRTWSMGYYKEAELQFQFALANSFTLCDAYHCSFHGGTNPNRLFLWTGTNDPTGTGGGPAINNQFSSLGPSSEGYSWKTYPERLEEAGVSWKVYQNHPYNFSDNALEGFRAYREANERHGNDSSGFPWPPYLPAHSVGNPLYKGAANTMPDLGLLGALRRDVAAGELPQVSWVVAGDRYSEHPDPSSPVLGGWYVQQVLEALTSNPDVWSRTVLLVNFDENDGFFDHLPPPCAPSRNADGSLAGGATVDTASERHGGEAFHDGVYGPGPRVPMYVVSPWSRGGWVNSQSFDHTSVLRFLEQRFGVAEPNISAWRRAFCGDLTTCFDFATPNDAPPELPRRTLLESEAINNTQAGRDQVPLPSEDRQQAPEQPLLVRRSRALPYELHASAIPLGSRLQLEFANTGSAGAVFHVYDRLHLDRIPRRYGVEAGRALAGAWDLAADGGRYDLWVLGPNGWHRRFTGRLAGDTAQPEMQVCYEISRGGIELKMSNGSRQACRLVVADNAYFGGAHWTYELPAGRNATGFWELGNSHGWYDFSATIAGDPEFLRRFAGRVETGRPSFSDPAMETRPAG